MKSIDISRCKVFFDFDNTIALFDVLDDIIQRFAINDDWISYEQDWQKGKIGSLVCLENQLNSVRVTKKALSSYIRLVEIDPAFPKLCALLRKKGITPIILSDSFYFVIQGILKQNNLKGIKVYANGLGFRKDELIPDFPYSNKKCSKCAHCKKKNLLKEGGSAKIIYIGDGLSDVCAAQSADIVFAKGKLLAYFKKINKPCLPFKKLNDIYNRLKE